MYRRERCVVRFGLAGSQHLAQAPRSRSCPKGARTRPQSIAVGAHLAVRRPDDQVASRSGGVLGECASFSFSEPELVEHAALELERLARSQSAAASGRASGPVRTMSLASRRWSSRSGCSTTNIEPVPAEPHDFAGDQPIEAEPQCARRVAIEDFGLDGARVELRQEALARARQRRFRRAARRAPSRGSRRRVRNAARRTRSKTRARRGASSRARARSSAARRPTRRCRARSDCRAGARCEACSRAATTSTTSSSGGKRLSSSSRAVRGSENHCVVTPCLSFMPGVAHVALRTPRRARASASAASASSSRASRRERRRVRPARTAGTPGSRRPRSLRARGRAHPPTFGRSAS